MLRICCQDHLNESLSKLLFMTCSSFSIQPPFVLSPIDRSCIPRVASEQPTFSNVTIGFPAKWRLRNERRNSTVTTCYCLDRNASDWFKQISLDSSLDQSEVLPRLGWWHVINMESVLRSFLRRHFAGKPVVASRNVGWCPCQRVEA